ncbi:MAG TPA: hypothetical protein VHC69_00755 [Polyangiaceae bacterium]|nr:hypothetical protein [Polyangiaceae bacterium]
MQNRESVSIILDELEAVLRAEHEALRKLDYEGIERASEQKLALDARLRAADATKTAADVPKLTRVRKMALNNQLLIVHARACLTSIIGMVTGEAPATYPGATSKRMHVAPIRLSVRV